METIARVARDDVLYPPATLNPVDPGAGQAGIPLTDLGPILIASPHPDDETLGCGGLISRCARCPRYRAVDNQWRGVPSR